MNQQLSNSLFFNADRITYPLTYHNTTDVSTCCWFPHYLSYFISLLCCCFFIFVALSVLIFFEMCILNCYPHLFALIFFLSATLSDWHSPLFCIWLIQNVFRINMWKSLSVIKANDCIISVCHSSKLFVTQERNIPRSTLILCCNT